jgi:hypothetical protein
MSEPSEASSDDNDDKSTFDEFKEAHLEKSRIIKLGENQFVITNKGMLPKK